MLSQQKSFRLLFFFSAADEPGALDQPRKRFAKVSSLPLLGLEYFHGYLYKYSAKEQMRKRLQGVADQFPVRALYVQVDFTGRVKRFTDLLRRMNLQP